MLLGMITQPTQDSRGNVSVWSDVTTAGCQTVCAVCRGWQVPDSEFTDLQKHEAGGESGQAPIMAGAALKVGAQSTKQHEEGGHQHAVVGQPRRRHVAVGAPVLAH